MNPRLFSFVGGPTGQWRVVSSNAIVGEPMPEVSYLDIVLGSVQIDNANQWVLKGVTSNERYANRNEKDELLQKQAPIGRPNASLSALIPIRKNASWWALTQDERRALFEERSRHVTIGLKYLPAIARRLHHCRDLEESQPFDFLTLFDYDKEDESAFDDMLAELRATEEWKFIDREVDIRLEKRTEA
jgi:chlorite dismutase